MGKVEFRRNKDTGIIEAYKGGIYIGSVVSMGEQIICIKTRMPKIFNGLRQICHA